MNDDEFQAYLQHRIDRRRVIELAVYPPIALPDARNITEQRGSQDDAPCPRSS